MAKSGKTPKTKEAEAFDFPLDTKRKLKAKTKEWILTNSENLCADFQRVRNKIDWDALRQSSTVVDVDAALSAVDQYTRARFPNVAAILATVRDPNYPKLRPIRFLAQSCALSRTYPNSGDAYSPRYSRDVCYQEKKRRGPPPKPITDLEYWHDQAKLGRKVPVKYLGRINKLQAEEQARSQVQKMRTELTYVDIPEKIEGVKKKRTTVWLPETTVAKLKKVSAATGAPMAELFRRAVEEYLKTS
jgi:hypothetical protein